MNRRGFLGALMGASLDPERLLWTPGKKLISIPAQKKVWDDRMEILLTREEVSRFCDLVIRHRDVLGNWHIVASGKTGLPPQIAVRTSDGLMRHIVSLTNEERMGKVMS